MSLLAAGGTPAGASAYEGAAVAFCLGARAKRLGLFLVVSPSHLSAVQGRRLLFELGVCPVS